MFEGILGIVVCTSAVGWLISATRTEPMLGWFCLQYEVPDSVGARSLVRAYLFRTRAWRVVGAFTGLVLSPLVLHVSGGRVPVLASIGVGWMIGGLLGEIVGRRRRAGATVPSMLRTRDLLPATARHTIVLTVLVTALALVMATAARVSPLVTREDVGLPTPGRLVSVAAAAVVLAIVSWRGVHAIREQPLAVTGSELDLVEHAIRTASAVRVVAGWSALQLLGAGWLSWQTADVVVAPLAWLAGGLALGGFAGAAASWWWMPTRPSSRLRGTAVVP